MTTLGAAERPTVTMGWDKYRDGPRARDARGGRTGRGEARVGRRRTFEIVAWVVPARGDAGAGARGAKVACWVRRVTNTEREHEGAKKAARGVASAPPPGASRVARDRSERAKARAKPWRELCLAPTPQVVLGPTRPRSITLVEK